jgi:hypothetical protein
MPALANRGELEAHLNRTFDPEDEVRADMALDLASGAVRAYCGWELAREAVTFQVDGEGGNVLTLPTLELIDVLEIRIADDVQTLGLPLTDYGRITWWRKGQLYRHAGWPTHTVIEVDVIHGYDPVPDLIKLVTLDMAARTLSNPEGLVSATTGQVSKTWASSSTQALTALHFRLLDRYRI